MEQRNKVLDGGVVAGVGGGAGSWRRKFVPRLQPWAVLTIATNKQLSQWLSLLWQQAPYHKSKIQSHQCGFWTNSYPSCFTLRCSVIYFFRTPFNIPHFFVHVWIYAASLLARCLKKSQLRLRVLLFHSLRVKMNLWRLKAQGADELNEYRVVEKEVEVFSAVYNWS